MNKKKYFTVYKLGNFKATYPSLELAQWYIDYDVRHGAIKSEYTIKVEWFFE